MSFAYGAHDPHVTAVVVLVHHEFYTKKHIANFSEDHHHHLT
jgi:hypothetical protein